MNDDDFCFYLLVTMAVFGTIMVDLLLAFS